MGQFLGCFGVFSDAIWLDLPVFCSLFFWGDGAVAAPRLLRRCRLGDAVGQVARLT